jgi:hypothetical protein
MAGTKNLVFCPVIAFLLLSLYALYIRFFPLIISPFVSNLIIIGILAALFLILAGESFLVRTPRDLAMVLPQYLLFVFLTRAIPAVRLAYQPLVDPYYYFICAFNVDTAGTLSPVYSWWYDVVKQQLTWPALQIIATFLMNLTGIHSVDFLRLVPPLLGIVFFMGVFLLAREITRNNGIALLAGLFATSGDTVLFYQSEFHPQGLAFVLFVFLVFSIIRHFSNPSPVNGFLLVIFSLVFAFSHHFSTLFLGLFSLFMISVLCVMQKLSWFDMKNHDSSNFSRQLIPWIILAFVMFINHLYQYSAFLEVSRMSIMYLLHPAGYLIAMDTHIPVTVTILNAVKYLLLFLAVMSLFCLYTTRKKNQVLAFIILAGLVIFGIAGTFIAFLPVDRIIGFYIPFAATFAALTLFAFRRRWFPSWNPAVKTGLVLFVSLIILIAGPFNFFGPGILLHDVPKNSYYWHSGDYSDFSSFGIPGKWIQGAVVKDSGFLSFGSVNAGYTFMIPYYYGEIARTYPEPASGNPARADYFIYNRNYVTNNVLHAVALKNEIYTSGRFVIGRSPENPGDATTIPREVQQE